MTTVNLMADNYSSIGEDNKRYMALWAETLRQGLVAAAKYFLDLEKTTDNHRDYRWMFYDDKHPGSFVWICDVLELSPDYVRSKWRENIRMVARMERYKGQARYKAEDYLNNAA